MNIDLNGTCADKTTKMDGIITDSSTTGDKVNKIPKIENGESYTFLSNVYERLIKIARLNIKRDSPVLNFCEPAELLKKINFEISEDGEEDDVILAELENVCRHSVNTSHPYCFNQLFAGVDQYALAGSALTDLMNSSAYTYEMAPVFSLQERYLFKKMMTLIGWQDGQGIFAPGGSLSNMYAINCARYKQFPDIKAKGMQSLPALAIFTSDQSHYSMKKGVAFLGIGTDNLISVKCDAAGRMLPEELEKAIKKSICEGKHPLLVNATSGTTVLGAFDPIDPLADLCDKYGIWLHLDAAWGGSVLMSRKHRHLMTGSHRADSVTWNSHKMLGIPQQCSTYLVKHKNILSATFCANASYLFQQDKFYDVSYDTGDSSLQCGRKVDVVKFWLAWKKHGDRGMEERIDRAFDNARYLKEKIKKTEGFELVFEPEYTNIGFWYVPPSLRGQESESNYMQRLSLVAPKIKEGMMRRGSMMVGYQPCGQWVNFFRMIVINPLLTTQDMDFVVDEIRRLGENL